MSAAKKIDKKGVSILDLTDINELRDYYHSIDLNETLMAVTALKKIGTVDATRELTQLYADCLWRKIKIEIIQALGSHSNQRSLEFLFELAKSDADLSLSFLAIEALAQTQNILAARFLENLYQHGHKTKKMSIVLALVQLADKNALVLFTEDLSQALENKEYPLAKNLIYALGELRAHTTLDKLKAIISGPYPKDIRLSAVTSIGKISRQPSDLKDHADQFKQDAFEYQIFQQAQNQISFRTDWKLEDYLNKLFQSNTYHKNLPLELNAFSPEDVFAGLEIFHEPQNFKKMAATLGLLNFKETLGWYKTLFQKDYSSPEHISLISRSLSCHFSENCLELIQHLALYNLDLAHGAAVACLPSADTFFKNFIGTDEYKNGTDALKIKTLNFIVDLLSIQHDAKLATSMAKFLENELQVEPSVDVKNRIIRVLAQTKLPSYKVFSVFKSFLNNIAFTQSILFYLEHHPSHQSATFLKENIGFFENQILFYGPLLKALTAQENNFFGLNEIKKIVTSGLSSHESNHQVQALRFLSKNEFKDFKPSLFTLIKDQNPLVVLNAIIAIKSLPDEDIPDLLQPLLNSSRESVKGRALDAILHNPSLRGKRIAIDFLKANIEHIEFSEKIIRTLAKSDIKSDYFYNAVSEIIKNYPQHTLLESLQDLQVKLKTNLHESQLKNIPSAADLVAIDKEIMRHLPLFNNYDESIKASLRSAELPFNKPELFDQFVDKSVCILGFTKAIDIFLEKQFGKKVLIPRLESRLHEFQNLIHSVHLSEDHPDAARLLTHLGLEKHFSPHSLPVHKMTLIGKGLLSSKIINEQFKILDGLRAWGITFLLFTRKLTSAGKPLIAVNFTEAQCIDIAKKLIWLQDLRNPVAHRHTMTKLDDIKEIREESYRLLSQLEKVLM